MRRLLVSALALLAAGAAGAGAPAFAQDSEAIVAYDRDVRPILADRCFKCHGPDAGAREAGLRLDLVESATAPREDGAAIVPGDPGASRAWQRVTAADPEERMPPPHANKRPLDERELAIVRRWIETGAKYEPHWSFVPPVRPGPPQVADSAWAANPIDDFVLAELERRELAPSAPAAADALVRRLYLDLTGLPPTPEEIDAFTSEAGADAASARFDAAWRRLAERLMSAEPYASRFAEHMATPWLDAARYADTCGIHTDAGRQMWAWRDWLLGALRDGMPFDRFLTEQLAGDLLPDATQAQQIASGFNRNHVTTDEGGAIAEEYLVEYAVDRAATTAQVFLGLTLGCARCHEHKFDPISQPEFYSFYAFFNSVDEPGLYSQLPDAKRAFEPFLEIPSDGQRGELARLEAGTAAARAELEAPLADEAGEMAAWLERTRAAAGVSWAVARPMDARSEGGAELRVLDDGSVLASGANPDRDRHVLELAVEGRGLDLLCLEALGDASFAEGRVGRAENGNAVLTSFEAWLAEPGAPGAPRALSFSAAWADVEQPDGDFAALNVLAGGDELGWAVDAHRRGGGRALLLLCAEPFDAPAGSVLRVELGYQSVYARHVLGRVRLSAGSIDPGAGLKRLPLATSSWYQVGPFPEASRATVYRRELGPEKAVDLDFAARFGAGGLSWTYVQDRADGRLNGDLPKGLNSTFVGRRVFAPSARRVAASLGTDDGYRLLVDGVEVAAREVDRSLEADQERVELELAAGWHALVLEVVNTGGDAGFYWRWDSIESGDAGEGDEASATAAEAGSGAPALSGALLAALLPDAARSGERLAAFETAWRLEHSPSYRARVRALEALEAELAALRGAIPLTMVMRELETPRPTFVLRRGAYDQPDESQPVVRGVPAALGALPEGAPLDRRGLAQWMVAPENPLVARVQTNRLWEQVFGAGLVRTSEDFGMQGEWPSHPALLDWLAVELIESGWDAKHLLELMVTSRTYRQDSRARADAVAIDPDNRLLASFPRRRLTAEQIRDQALYASGLLVERFGGPSVKPYQPEGLWQEVAMPASNTKAYERGLGEDLWRRSLYTYWKRACPPPSLMAFDAPTREFCAVRRTSTNTPLQQLALWNDEQYVEAARALAARTLAAPGDDGERLATLFRRCTGRAPLPVEFEFLAEALADWRARYAAAPADAAALVEVGESMVAPGVDARELAAWTLVANAVFALDETLTRS